MTPPAMDHAESFEALGAYALGALPPGESEALELHLRSCRACREQLLQLQLAADALAASVPAVEPPPALKQRVMAVVNSEAEVLAAAGPSAGRPRAGRRRGGRRGARAFPRPVATAAAAAAALAAGLVAGVVLRDGGRGPAPAPSARLVSARITDPGMSQSARAAVRVSGGHASLVVHGLPDPAVRRVYQVWLKAAGHPPVPAGATFAVRSGTIELPHGVRAGEQVLVTSEPLGGSRNPTRAPLIVSPPI